MPFRPTPRVEPAPQRGEKVAPSFKRSYGGEGKGGAGKAPSRVPGSFRGGKKSSEGGGGTGESLPPAQGGAPISTFRGKEKKRTLLTSVQRKEGSSRKGGPLPLRKVGEESSLKRREEITKDFTSNIEGEDSAFPLTILEKKGRLRCHETEKGKRKSAPRIHKKLNTGSERRGTSCFSSERRERAARGGSGVLAGGTSGE